MNKPICNNCKYKSQLMGTAMCNRPSGVVSLISGHQGNEYISCSMERLFEDRLYRERCGPSGKFFVPSGWFKLKQKIKNLFG
jgi:hypothetical protein